MYYMAVTFLILIPSPTKPSKYFRIFFHHVKHRNIFKSIAWNQKLNPVPVAFLYCILTSSCAFLASINIHFHESKFLKQVGKF